MVVTKYFAKLRAVTGALAAGSLFIAAHPAMANSSASTDIAAPLRAAQSSQNVSGQDEQYRKLFNTWQSYEETGDAALAASSARPVVSSVARSMAGVSAPVSIPSRTPLDNVRLTSNFGTRVHPVTGGLKGHKGLDMGAPIGTPIYATADGVISKASWWGGYGLFVSIEHGGELETRYGHMSRLNVAEGQRVRKGEIIGFVGSTGRSTGPHLHYEVRVRGEAVNPIPYMQTQVASASDEAKGG